MRFALLALLLGQAADPAGVAEELARVHRRAEKLDDPAAVAELRAAIELPFPAGPDGDQLRGDVYAELSRRLLRGGNARAALDAARDGLTAIAPEPSPVAALLRLREAEALEALGRVDEAVTAYERTIEIARSLIEKENP